MKKFLISLAAVLGISMAASAQSPEIQVGYGGYTQMDATNMHKGGGVKNAWGALTAWCELQGGAQAVGRSVVLVLVIELQT